MKSKLEIYALSVCFAAVVSLVISTGIAGYAIVSIAAPRITMRSYDYDRFQTNDLYWEKISSCSKNEPAGSRPAEEELTRRRLEAFDLELESERREGVQNLLQCLMFILVSGGVLIIHWKIARKARAA
jgi:hypothetical protein